MMASPQAVSDLDLQPHGPQDRGGEMSWPTKIIAGWVAMKAALPFVLGSPFVPIAGARPYSFISIGQIWILLLAPAVVLWLANTRRFRTWPLALMLTTMASTFAAAPLRSLEAHSAARWLWYIHLQGFEAYFLGMFLLNFPQPRTGAAARRLLLASRAGAAFAWLQLLYSVARAISADLWGLQYVPQIFVAVRPFLGGIGTTLLGNCFMIAVLAVNSAGLDGVLPSDRRRHRRMLLAWLMIVAPLVTSGIFFLFMGERAIAPGQRFKWLTLAMNLSGAFGPSVAVWLALEGRKDRQRAAARRGVHILFSGAFLSAMALLPFTGFVWLAYVDRNMPVETLFTRSVVTWLIVGFASAAMLTQRRRLLNAVDHWLFRETYDADARLFELTSVMRKSTSIEELTGHVLSGVERALHPHRAVVLVRDESAAQFVAPLGSVEPLPANSLLVDLLTAGRGALETPLNGGASPMRWLPQEERYWLVDAGAHVVAPMHASDGSLNGFIAIADRPSGRPYTDDDRRWLTAVAESASLTIETHSRAANDARGHQPWKVGLVQRYARAVECAACGAVEEAGAAICPHCGSATTTSLVPRLLYGKFRFEQRIGRGGMGVVYRATDLTLERQVAVKMLPGATPEYSELLRVEARAMAAVAHKHLAVVYGVEDWRGQPLLVCEYMTHGTLADRLVHGPLRVDDAMALAMSIVEALQVLHAKQLLHRDVKPSNIGFDSARVPKLLDFGLAQLLSTSTQLPEDLRPETHAAGTPMYMSPDAVAGQTPAPGFDLWSLNVMLYEALTGVHPFKRDSAEATLASIVSDAAPPVVCSEALPPKRIQRIQHYFDRALSKDSAIRYRTADDVHAALRALMT